MSSYAAEIPRFSAASALRAIRGRDKIRDSENFAATGLCNSHTGIPFAFLRDVRHRVWQPASCWLSQPGNISACHLLDFWRDGRKHCLALARVLPWNGDMDGCR